MSLRKFTRIEAVEEGVTKTFEVIVRDKDGVLVPKSAVTAITVSLCDRSTATTINSRSATDILDANGGTMGTTDGKISWDMAALDHAIVDTTLNPLNEEAHLMVITVTHSNGLVDKRPVDFFVRKLGK